MRNRLLLIALLLGFATFTKAQIIDTILEERFDVLPFSGTTGRSPASLTVDWVISNSIPNAPSSPNSLRAQGANAAGRVWWETPLLDLTGKTYVLLEFEHISKIHYSQDRGRILFSLDNGLTWDTIRVSPGSTQNAEYLGQSPNYANSGNNYWNELNYPNPLPPGVAPPHWGGPSVTSAIYPANNWWKKEVYNVSQAFADTTVILRFERQFLPGPGQLVSPSAMPGWFLDNVFVIGADCNLIPPSISFTLNPPLPTSPPSANYNNQPTGLQPCAGNYRIALDATDNNGVDSVELFYRINFGPWIKRNMPNITGARYVDTIPGTQLNDTIEWYVRAWDEDCPNNTRRPVDSTQYYMFYIGDQPPQKCGTWYQCGNVNVPYVVTSLPWIVDFEDPEWGSGTGPGTTGNAHRGTMPIAQGNKDWIVFPALNLGNFGWSVRQGATPTNLTGPNVDNTLKNSSGKYLYAAAMQSGSQTLLTSHCVEVPDDSCLYIEFFYYMYGQNVQELRLDVDTGSNTESWVDGVWLLSGQQQTGPNQPWRRAYVSLENFKGKTLRFRWRATKIGSLTRGDIAIDDIRVDYASPADMEAELLIEPLPIGCNFSANEPVSMLVRNIGCNSATNIPVAYSVNGGAPVWDTIPGPLDQGDTITFTFTQGANIATVGTYDIKAWTAIPGDGNTSNDTTNTVTVTTVPIISTFPHVLSFDGPGNTPGNGTFANPGVISTTDWDRIPDPTATGASGYAFMVGHGMTPTIGTGPFTDVSGFGNYLYAEGNFGSTSTPAMFESNCFDLSLLNNPVFDLYYHGYSAPSTFDSLCINILPTGSTSWITPPGGRITTFTQNDELSPWTYRKFDLSPYGSGRAKIRIVAYRRSSGDRVDVAIDNLAVYNEIQQDAGIFNVQPPGLGLPLAANPLPVVHIRNFGSQALTSVPIVFEITPLCGPNQGQAVTYNATATVNIAPGQTGTFQLPASTNIVWPEGRFEICARTAITTDGNTWNDEFCKYVTGFGTKTIPWSDNFDDCDHSSQGWFAQSGKQIWEVGNPSFGTMNAPSPPNAWFTNLSGPYYPNTEEHLRVPLITGFDTVQGVIIQFSQFQASPNAHGGRLETFEANSWGPLGSVNAGNVGVNWHSHSPYGVAATPLFPSGPAWVNNTNGWINSSYPLFDYNYSSTTLQLRYHWKSTPTGTPGAGWGIDNFEIIIPPQNSAAPDEIESSDNLIFPFVDQEIHVTIQNTGQKPLDSCKLSVSFDGGNTWGNEYWYSFNPPLNFGQRSMVIYPDVWTSPSPGSYQICAATSRPNNKQDNNPSDDTLCSTLSVFPEIDLSTEPNNEYCNNFDNPDPNAFHFVPMHATLYFKGLFSWDRGLPNQNPIFGAASGNNAWMTDLTDNYFSQDNSALCSPVFIIDSVNTTYELSFKHNFKTEKGHDGGHVEYSQDGGITWGVLGEWESSPGPDYTWYNEPFIFGLDNIKPGWTHNSNGWQDASIKFCFEVGGQTMFRFRFGSDNNIEDAGWAVDDFCIREINDACDYLISKETFIEDNGLVIAPPAPNPAEGHTYIAYSLPRAGDMRMHVTNLLGQSLFEEIDNKQAGRGQTNFDVSTWRNGVYLVVIEYEGKTYTSKLIVNH